MRINGVQRQIEMAVKSASTWPEHKIREAKQIFLDTATITNNGEVKMTQAEQSKFLDVFKKMGNYDLFHPSEFNSDNIDLNKKTEDISHFDELETEILKKLGPGTVLCNYQVSQGVDSYEGFYCGVVLINTDSPSYFHGESRLEALIKAYVVKREREMANRLMKFLFNSEINKNGQE